jgi:hypothetical protein
MLLTHNIGKSCQVLRYHYAKNIFKKGLISLTYYPTTGIVADEFTEFKQINHSSL